MEDILDIYLVYVQGSDSAKKQGEGPKLATRGGEWEPIKISLEIDPLAYIPKITTNPRT